MKKKTKKTLTYEEARRYIEGENFDEIEYERRHLLMLAESVKRASTTINSIYYQNLIKTAERWIENHKNTICKNELDVLIDTVRDLREKEMEEAK